MMAKLISTLELHNYPMIHFLIIPLNPRTFCYSKYEHRKPVQPAQVTTLVSKIQQIGFQSKHSDVHLRMRVTLLKVSVSFSFCNLS